ncbi:MAG: hypothetical protein IPJ98_10395 [Bryobacterales bacterium]|nr:hypothetical protein [Bryobacterales bacterium]
MLWFGLAIDGLGQFLGYLTGPGRSAEILSDFEYNRVRFLSLADRKQVLSPDA